MRTRRKDIPEILYGPAISVHSPPPILVRYWGTYYTIMRGANDFLKAIPIHRRQKNYGFSLWAAHKGENQMSAHEFENLVKRHQAQLRKLRARRISRTRTTDTDTDFSRGAAANAEKTVGTEHRSVRSLESAGIEIKEWEACIGDPRK